MSGEVAVTGQRTQARSRTTVQSTKLPKSHEVDIANAWRRLAGNTNRADPRYSRINQMAHDDGP